MEMNFGTLAIESSALPGLVTAGVRYRGFCSTFGLTEYATRADLKTVLEALAIATIAPPRPYWTQIKVGRNVEQHEIPALERKMADERDRRVREAQLLFVQIFHLWKKYGPMTPPTVAEARRYYDRIVPGLQRTITPLAATRR